MESPASGQGALELQIDNRRLKGGIADPEAAHHFAFGRCRAKVALRDVIIEWHEVSMRHDVADQEVLRNRMVISAFRDGEDALVADVRRRPWERASG